MAAAYPSTLPLARFNKTREQAASFKIAQPRRGYGFVEPIGTDVPVFWNLTWTFTGEQAQTFWQWFVYTLDRGVLPFEMEVRTEFGLVAHELQLMPDGLLPARQVGWDVWEYTATVMAREALGVTAPAGAWNPADKDSDVSLIGSVASVTSALGSVRGIQSRNTASAVNRYFEVTIGGPDGRSLVGLGSGIADLSNYPGSDANGFAYYGFNGILYSNGSTGNTNATFGPGDVVGVLLNGVTLLFYKNGALQTFGFTLSAGDYFPMWGPGGVDAGTRTGELNTGGPFYALPSGAQAWSA